MTRRLVSVHALCLPAGVKSALPSSREALVRALRQLGVRAGDAVMVHASLRAVGPVEGGAEGVLDAYLAQGSARHATVGQARSELLDAEELVQFGVRWMSERFG